MCEKIQVDGMIIGVLRRLGDMKSGSYADVGALERWFDVTYVMLETWWRTAIGFVIWDVITAGGADGEQKRGRREQQENQRGVSVTCVSSILCLAGRHFVQFIQDTMRPERPKTRAPSMG
jgi:hypothetical protein